MELSVSRNESGIVPELYFLIAKFLAAGPCPEAAAALKRELERAEVLPLRLDWEGHVHSQSFEELERKYPHIGSRHLLQICARIGPVLEKDVPPCVPGAISLLGAGRQSLLRTHEDLTRYTRSIVDYSGRLGAKPFLERPGSLSVPNIVRVLQGRENSGPLSRREAIPTKFYSKMQLYRHTLGHLSAVYCVLFDRTGKYIITGADDLLVKVWSSIDGRLLSTFRGASAEIMDIAVNFDNTLLAAGSLDRILRVWCFQTMSPVAVLSGHSGMITSVNFCPIVCNDVYYLVSTSTDGSVAFWSHTQQPNERALFQSKPIQYHEKMRPGQAQMICASFSPGGAFMAAGSADHNVRVYAMLGDEGPRRVLEIEAHSDTVDSIQWAHSGLRFISGSKDGTANVWHFEQQQWLHKQLLMTTKLPGEPETDDDTNKKAKVTMVSWDVSDEFVITAVNDSSLKVWNAKSGELIKVLRGHKDEVFVLESHPIDPRVILSAGHDGQLIIWDVLNTEPMACFQNFIEGQGNGAVFDAKWSPDGTMLAATDSHGHLLMYGFGSGVERLKIIPKELFFHTDYRPLIRDSNNYVLDEQTQTAPHLMPPPFLVDVDGNPYPPALQRLVPGRENCRGEQLVPNIAVGAGGVQEVIEGLPEQEPRSNIDRLIEALAQRQNIDADGEVAAEDRENNVAEQPVRQIASPRASRPGLRRVGDVEGVRQSSGNWQRDSTTPWNKPILARPMNTAVRETQIKAVRAMADMELDNWRREMRRRPQSTSSTAANQGNIGSRLVNRKRNRTTRHGYRTRATRGEEQEDEEFENPDNVGTSASSASSNSNDSTAHEEDLCSDSTTTDSSTEYSDWIADHGLNLEPPKRSKRKPVKKRSLTPPSDTDRRRSRRPKKKEIPVVNGREVPEAYRPSEWLTEVIPRKAPYYPQMGDEIVYFRQGHKLYLDAIRNKKVYELSPRCEPWTKMNIRAQEFVKVVGIKYEIRPPRLCCLKLALMDEDGRMTGENFTIKYHDMADVLDFLVLRQTFDTALVRSWSEGDKFRCMIDDGWWMGQIISMEPLDEDFPDSFFMCFHVRWDNGEHEQMSPWDLEPVDEDRLPAEIGGAVSVLPEEIRAILYQPHAEEWPMGDREATCRRIIRGLDQVMSLAIAEPFVAPVDLNTYPTYAYIVEYPIDLSTIKARFENHFYRRITSAQFDVRYLATNAEQFNEPHSTIVKQARIVTDLCLRIIKETTQLDVPAVYHQLLDTYHSSESEVDVDDSRNKPSTSKQRSSTSSRNLRSQDISRDWKLACRQLLESLWQCEDSIPFREPVDRLEHPDYHQIIDTPMDLRTVKEDLLGGNYDTPVQFAKDMKLIFTNSRNYNTNKRSRIYSMTIRLSAMFEEHMRRILSTWKTARKRNNNNVKTNTKGKGKQKKKHNLTNGTEPPKSKSAHSDDDDDDDDANSEDDDDESGKEPKKNSNLSVPGPSRLANGDTKRSTSGSSRPMLKLRISRSSTKKRRNNDSDVSESEASDTDSSDSAPVRRTRARTALPSVSADTDSGDNYTPGGRSKQVRKNRGKNNKNSRYAKSKAKSNVIVEDDEDDDDDANEDNEEEEEEEDDEEERFVAPESTEESEDEKFVRRDTRSRKLATRNEESQKYVANNGKSNNNSDSESEDDNEEEEEQDEQSQHETNNQDSDSDDSYKAFKPTPRASRRRRHPVNSRLNVQHTRRRGLKRPRYNEESDDSITTPVRNRRKIKRRSYAEDSDEESPPTAEPEPEPQPGISISSRGRVRKMTPRARAYLLEAP
ncbi:PH-interacting protein isoform X2 [Harpegnathos saltator]|uniref:Bromodomain and WD repeat-containing protein 3 n=1 Tax=Harpegnathos saltator TaxID=610380 RepID=E2B3T4_HARSA|nr:PH-interacting protein isoform X2 [Harpegnathos saltator]EFN89603.1 Bromodomain and WD repeat-containing protein 3 [Harpegnathos saltator]